METKRLYVNIEQDTNGMSGNKFHTVKWKNVHVWTVNLSLD